MLNKQTIFSQKLESLKTKLPSGSQLLIVSKTRPMEEIQIYYDLGHRDFGENRVQDLLEKATELIDSCPDIRWHMIGHLQSNKIPQLFSVPNLWAIHSVDSKDLLEKLLKSQQKLPTPVNLFLQFNTSKEEEKSGLETYEELLEVARLIPSDSRLKLHGLMTMGSIRSEDFSVAARKCFHELNQIKDSLSKDLSLPLCTSMGMSQDYEIALEEHSGWIRLGTMMFAL